MRSKFIEKKNKKSGRCAFESVAQVFKHSTFAVLHGIFFAGGIYYKAESDMVDRKGK